jgi:hypothetical protein
VIRFHDDDEALRWDLYAIEALKVVYRSAAFPVAAAAEIADHLIEERRARQLDVTVGDLADETENEEEPSIVEGEGTSHE